MPQGIMICSEKSCIIPVKTAIAALIEWPFGSACALCCYLSAVYGNLMEKLYNGTMEHLIIQQKAPQRKQYCVTWQKMKGISLSSVEAHELSVPRFYRQRLILLCLDTSSHWCKLPWLFSHKGWMGSPVYLGFICQNDYIFFQRSQMEGFVNDCSFI